MTVTVHAPGGVNINFPDGTDQATISAVMARHFGGRSAAAKSPSPSLASGLARSFAEGVPVLGGLLNKADAATNAALAPVLNPLFPKDQQLQGDFGQRYHSALATQDEMDRSFGEAHPLAKTAAEVAGGVASTGAAAGTGLGAKLLGLGAETLPGMIGQGAASGAALGAADAAVRGNNPMFEGVLGGVAGAAGPVVGRVVSKVASPIAQMVRSLRDPEGEAARQVFDRIATGVDLGRAPLRPEEIATATAAGQPLNLMDVGGQPALRLARTAANYSPVAQDKLMKTIGDRFRTQGDRLADWLGSKFNYPDTFALRQALKQAQKNVGGPAYRRAYAQGANGLWSPELERLAGSDAVTGAMQRAIKNAKDEAIVSGHGAMNPRLTFTDDGRIQFHKGPAGVPTYPDLQFWDLTRRELSDAAKKAMPGSAEARRLWHFAHSLNDELDRMVPAYAAARGIWAKYGEADNALEAGQNAVTAKFQNREMAADLAKMTPGERKLFQDGFVDRYVQNIREAPDRRSVLSKIAASPAARERLNIALGPDKAKELEAFLHVEDIMDRARTQIGGNSTTAQQLGDMQAFDLTDIASPKKVLTKILTGMAKKTGLGVNEKVAEHIANLLTSTNRADIDKGLTIIVKNKALMAALRQRAAASGAIGVRGTAPALGRAAEGPTNGVTTDAGEP